MGGADDKERIGRAYDAAKVELGILERGTANTRAEHKEFRNQYKVLSETFRSLGDYEDSVKLWNKSHEKYREHHRQQERPGLIAVIIAIVLAIVSFTTMILSEYMAETPGMLSIVVVSIVAAVLFAIILLSDRDNKMIRRRLALIVSIFWNGAGIWGISTEVLAWLTGRGTYLPAQTVLAYIAFISGLLSCILAMIFSRLGDKEDIL